MSAIAPLGSWERHGAVLRPSPGSWDCRGVLEPSLVPVIETGKHRIYYTGTSWLASTYGYAEGDTPLGPFVKPVYYDVHWQGEPNGSISERTHPDSLKNFIIDPSFEKARLNGCSPNWAFVLYVAGTVVGSRVAALTLEGEVGGGNEDWSEHYAQRVQYTGIEGDVTGYFVFEYYADRLAVAPVGDPDIPAAGEDATFSFLIKGEPSACTMVAWVQALNSVGGNLGFEEVAVDLSAAVQRVTVTYINLPVGTTCLSVQLRVTGITSGRIVDFTIDDAILSPTSEAVDYFDGYSITNPLLPVSASAGTVTRIGDIYYMLQPGGVGYVDMTMRKSTDGIHFGDPRTLFSGTPGEIDETYNNNARPFVDDDGTHYIYWEIGPNDATPHMLTGVAVSDSDMDGNWTKYAGNPIAGVPTPVGQEMQRPQRPQA